MDELDAIQKAALAVHLPRQQRKALLCHSYQAAVLDMSRQYRGFPQGRGGFGTFTFTFGTSWGPSSQIFPGGRFGFCSL